MKRSEKLVEKQSESMRATNGSRLAAVVTALVGALLLSSGSLAQAQDKLQVDPAVSEVHFSLDSTHDPVKGLFKVTSGAISFDTHGAMSGMVTVDAASGESGNGSRDKKMKSDELKASLFPSVTFAPTRYTGTLNETGDSTIQVTGTFTLIGQGHEITVPMTVHIESGKCTATGSFPVPFVSWGMKDPSIMFLKVAKDVTIDLKLVGSVTR